MSGESSMLLLLSMQLIHQSKFNLPFALPHEQGHMKWAIKYIYPAKVFDIILNINSRRPLDLEPNKINPPLSEIICAAPAAHTHTSNFLNLVKLIHPLQINTTSDKNSVEHTPILQT